MDPKAYLQGNSNQRKNAVEFLSEYIHLVQWQHSKDEMVIDVGCGAGDVTCEVLKPMLPSSAKLIGADISKKMLDHAKRQYPDTEFIEMDIGTKKLPEKLCGAFDHVFSFLCIHWCQDERQVMKNLYDLLKPGGDMFVYYAAYAPIFDIYLEMAKTNMWKNYMPDVLKYIPPHQQDKNVKENVTNLLHDVGFQISVYKCQEGQYEFSSKKHVSNSILAIDPYYVNIPEELKEQYKEDITKELFKLKAMKESNENTSKNIIVPYKINVIFANKHKDNKT